MIAGAQKSSSDRIQGVAPVAAFELTRVGWDETFHMPFFSYCIIKNSSLSLEQQLQPINRMALQLMLAST